MHRCASGSNGNTADQEIPLATTEQTEVTRLPRDGDAQPLRSAAADLTTTSGAYAWVACDFGTTRNIVKSLKTIHNVPKSAIKATAYWK